MNFFKPAYYNKKKSPDRRLEAIAKEKNAARLKKAALDSELEDKVRAEAIRQLDDPEVCETILTTNLESAYVWESDYPEHYRAAAEALAKAKEEARMWTIYEKTINWKVRSAIIDNTENKDLLEEAAIYAESHTAERAIARIQDEAVLTRIACSSSCAGNRAVMKITSDAALREIVLKGVNADTRVEAIRRIKDPESVMPQLTTELLPIMAEGATSSETKLLALSGEPTARLILASRGENIGTGITEADYRNADPDILFNSIRRTLDQFLHSVQCANEEIIPAAAFILRNMHELGIKSKEIEQSYPKTIEYSYCHNYWTDEEYKYDKDTYTDAVTIWH